MPNAQTTGLSEDLNLIGNQYNWALTMFLIGYIILQIPANYIIACLYDLRICLGFTEAAFYLCIVFLLGSWYTKEELSTRTAVFVLQVRKYPAPLVVLFLEPFLKVLIVCAVGNGFFIIDGIIVVIISVIGFFDEMQELAITRLERQGRSSLVSGLSMNTFRKLWDQYGNRAYHIIAFWCIVLVAVNAGHVPVTLLLVCAYLVSPNVSNAPAYRLGKIVTMALTVVMILLCLFTFTLQVKQIMIPKAPQRIIDEEMNKSKRTSITNDDEL
ncbi:uncharacterized protein BX663DRAFT_529261 [Cokeromyces recurvatus]|uniref:uncharacterized protein n=1 Tax=Cokeromyces recurvatus TaxID=90255 RepID=UPI00221F1DA3|nr:uncharacterized protein BX663DRAFT_529261 [Cokeromyces recurvatus]KAI7906579.1 hypothetical protein BX663DRAFT_529261 [Cokeromyces recurvatus]